MAKARIVYKVDDKELDILTKKLKALGPEAEKAFKDWEKGLDEIEKKNKKATGSLIDLKSAVAGIGFAAMAGAAVTAFVKLNAQITKNRKEVALLTKQTGLGLDIITAKVQATAKVFDKDFNEVLRAANAVSKQLGISMTSVMDEINDAMSRGIDINGEYLETISEYSPFMRQAGIDFRQFNILIQKQLTEGIFSDKGIDAVKEGTISIREMTTTTRDAVIAIGLDAEKITADIQSGATTYFEVMQQIAIKTRELADPRITGQVLADIYRGAGEDAGTYALTLDTVGDAYAEVTEEEQKYIDNRKNLIQATEDTERALISLTSSTQGLSTSMATFWENLKGGTLRAIETTINQFIAAEDQVESFKQSVNGLGKETLGVVFDELIDQNKELNKELEKSNEIIAKGGSSPKRELLLEELAILDDKIQLVSKAMLDLTNQELLEAEAAKLVADAADLAAKAKIAQADAADKARQSALLDDLPELDRKGLDLKLQIADETLSIEEKLQNDLLVIKERGRQMETEAANAQKDIDREEEEIRLAERQELIFGFAQGTADIVAQFADLRIQQIGVELQAVELARNRELELAEGNKAKEAEINAKFDKQAAALKEKQAEAQKRSSIFQAVVATAVAVAQALPNVPLSVLAGILGAAQVAFIAAQPVPKFAKGVLDLQGNGTGTSDSIPAMLSKGESVITAAETSDYLPTLQAIQNREISPDILNNISMHRDTQPTIVVNDYDKLAKAVMRQPQKNVIVDENGFTGYIVSQSQVIQKKQSKYKM